MSELTMNVHTSANAPDGELRMIPIENLHESPWNPRQYYPDGPMQELIESMRVSGYREWLPLMVRPAPDGFGYEIGAGHRRRRAAEAAGIEILPCVVRDLSDAQFLDVLNFDNTGREDVHPLHEAAGWRAWMEKTGQVVMDIANRIGQSKEYVYQRLKYGALIPDAAKAFLDGKLTAGHAILIARLDPKGQQKALKACTPPYYAPEKTVSVRELGAWIQKNLHCTLDDAAFALDDAELIPSAGSCTACPFRLGNMPEFNAAEDLPSVCTRPECFDQKETAHWAQVRARVADKREVVVPELPTEFMAPTTVPAPKRAKPSKEEKAAAEERERRAAEDRERKRLEEAERDREYQAKLAKEKTSRLRILRAILDKVNWPPRREEVQDLLGDVELPSEMDEILKAEGFHSDVRGFPALDTFTNQGIARLLVLVYVSGDFDTFAFNHGSDRLDAAAKRYGVDVRKVRAEAEGGTRQEVVKKLPVMGAKKAPAKITEQARQKIAKAQKDRWAAHNKQEAAKKSAAKPSPKKKAPKK